MRSLYFSFMNSFLCFFFCSALLIPAFAGPTIGVFSTDVYVYEYEGMGSKKYFALPEILQRDFDVVLVDYNLIYSDYLKKNKKVPLEKLIEEELEAKGVKKLILPADVYNLDMPPLHPTATKMRAYKSLLSLVKEKKVSVLGICGGTQELLHTDGIRISNLAQMGVKERHHKVSPLVAVAQRPGGYPERLIRKILINPASRIGKIVSQAHLEVNANGWLILYIPELHSEGIADDKDNLKVLRDAGYQVVGFSEDGVVEVFEDQFGNFYFQPHIESFVIEFAAQELSKEYQSSLEAAKLLLIHFVES